MPGIDTEELDSCCEILFGHTDWEFVEDKDTHITIKFNVEDTREEERQKTYKILVKFDATDEKDAEDFVYDMQPKDWLQHLEEEE